MPYFLRLKCTKFTFGWGSVPDNAGGLQRSPSPLAEFKGPTSKEREGKGSGREGRGGKRKGGRGRGHPLVLAYTPWCEILDKKTLVTVFC